MENESKYYPLIMNYRKELFNEFKRYCESRKVNLDRSRKYKALFPLKKLNATSKYYTYLEYFNSFTDFIEYDVRFSSKSKIEFWHRLAEIDCRYCLAFYKMNCVNPYKISKNKYLNLNAFYNVLSLYMPNELRDKWRLIYAISRKLGTNEDIELLIKRHLNYEK